ncbi:unnamed protein product [Sympodiomycopsis kandeliae]
MTNVPRSSPQGPPLNPPTLAALSKKRDRPIKLPACERCKIRKTKCEGGLPACLQCKKAGTECIEGDSWAASGYVSRMYIWQLERRLQQYENGGQPLDDQGEGSSAGTGPSGSGLKDSSKASAGKQSDATKNKDGSAANHDPNERPSMRRHAASLSEANFQQPSTLATSPAHSPTNLAGQQQHHPNGHTDNTASKRRRLSDAGSFNQQDQQMFLPDSQSQHSFNQEQPPPHLYSGFQQQGFPNPMYPPHPSYGERMPSISSSTQSGSLPPPTSSAHRNQQQQQQSQHRQIGHQAGPPPHLLPPLSHSNAPLLSPDSQHSGNSSHMPFPQMQTSPQPGQTQSRDAGGVYLTRLPRQEEDDDEDHGRDERDERLGAGLSRRFNHDPLSHLLRAALEETDGGDSPSSQGGPSRGPDHQHTELTNNNDTNRINDVRQKRSGTVNSSQPPDFDAISDPAAFRRRFVRGELVALQTVKASILEHISTIPHSQRLNPSSYDRLLLDRITQRYFRYVNSPLPALHEEVFALQLEDVYRGAATGSCSVNDRFQVLMAMACSLASLSRNNYEGSELGRLAAALWNEACTLLPHTARKGWRKLQNTVMLMQFGLLVPASEQVFSWCWEAMRLVVELGLYSLGNSELFRNTDALSLDILKRLFWSTYSIDRMLSCTLGRPSSLSDRWITTEMPSIKEDSAITTQGIDVNGPSCQLKVTNCYYIRLRRLQSEILDRLYAPGDTKKPKGKDAVNNSNEGEGESSHDLSTPGEDTPQRRKMEGVIEHDKLAEAEGDKLERENALLSEWTTSMQARLSAWHDEFSLPTPFITYHWVKLQTNLTLTMLYRPSPKRTEPGVGALQRALATSGEVLNIYHRLHREGAINFSSMAIRNLFVSGLTFLNSLKGLLERKIHVDIPFADIAKRIQSCNVVLDNLATFEASAEAGRIRDAFDSLSSRVFRTMAEDPSLFGRSNNALTPGSSSAHSAGSPPSTTTTSGIWPALSSSASGAAAAAHKVLIANKGDHAHFWAHDVDNVPPPVTPKRPDPSLYGRRPDAAQLQIQLQQQQQQQQSQQQQQQGSAMARPGHMATTNGPIAQTQQPDASAPLLGAQNATTQSNANGNGNGNGGPVLSTSPDHMSWMSGLGSNGPDGGDSWINSLQSQQPGSGEPSLFPQDSSGMDAAAGADMNFLFGLDEDLDLSRFLVNPFPNCMGDESTIV